MVVECAGIWRDIPRPTRITSQRNRLPVIKIVETILHVISFADVFDGPYWSVFGWVVRGVNRAVWFKDLISVAYQDQGYLEYSDGERWPRAIPEKPAAKEDQAR